MKKALVLALMVVIGLGLAAFAKPFVGFDYTIPDDGTLYFGVEAGELTLEWSVCDLFLYDAEDEPPMLPTLTFDAEHFTEFSYWDNALGFWIKTIDFVSAYPIPEIEGIGFSWRGTLHVGDLLSEKLTELSQTSSDTLDIYGEMGFEYQHSGSKLIPTGSFGFYWAP